GWRRRGVSRKLIELSLECVDSSKVFLVTHNPHVIGAFSGRGFLRAGRPYGAKNWWLLRAPNESSATEVTPKKCTESSNKAAPVLGWAWCRSGSPLKKVEEKNEPCAPGFSECNVQVGCPNCIAPVRLSTNRFMESTSPPV